jgi:RNA-binding protein YlmH
LSIFHHFRPEEKPLVERTIEWVELAGERKQARLTHFLDPREQFIVKSIAKRDNDVKVSFYGGYDEAERKKALIVPEFIEVSPEDFHVTLLSVQGSYKALEHRDVLGSLLGLGVKREKFGDILLSEESQQLIVSSDIADFIEIHLNQISRYSVSCQSISWDQLNASRDEWIMRDTTVSSLRLDVILSEVLNFSRTKVAPLIKQGRVKVNWRVVEHSSLTLEEGDVLSVKGHGRFLFFKVEGQTKKQKFRVQLGRIE